MDAHRHIASPRAGGMWLVAAALLAGAGCGGGSDEATEPDASPTPSDTTHPPGSTLIVDADGQGDFTRIQDAIDAASDGWWIRIRPGHYDENLDLGRKELIIIGEGAPAEVIIDGGDCRGVSCSAMRISGGQTARTQIYRLTLQGGLGSRCTGQSLTDSGEDRCGGGIAIQGASPTLEQLIIRQNSATRGGGIFVAGGGRVDGELLQIVDNTAVRGGGIALVTSGLGIKLSQIRGNVATQQGGGLDLVGSDAELSSILIADNLADFGGALSADYSSAGIEYATISGNEATILGGGLGLSNEVKLAIRGSILAHNIASSGPEGSFNHASSELSLIFTDVYNQAEPWGGVVDDVLIDGAGVISEDPRFIGDGDYRLAAESPCRDTGPINDVDPDASRADYGAFGGPEAGSYDLDADGFRAAWRLGLPTETWDCDDRDEESYPGHEEICDGADNDCDGSLSRQEIDVDGDGYIGCIGADDASPPDCDDTDPDINPSAVEDINQGDGIDDDCDEKIDEGTLGGDVDGDGYCEGFFDNDILRCGLTSIDPGDCDDLNDARFPGNVEICDGYDNDCLPESCDSAPCDELPLIEQDRDNDGFITCEPTEDSGLKGGDPNDTNDTVYPEAPEEPRGRPDGWDNDGDGLIDEGTVVFDDDGDGFCEAASGCEGDGILPGDCNDGAQCEGDVDCLALAMTVHPGAAEVCDGQDTNCDGAFPTEELDADGDGYRGCSGDCDDTNGQVHPGASDALQNGLDEDCVAGDLGAVGFTVKAEEEGPSAVALSCHQGASGPGGGWGAAALLLAGLSLRRRRRWWAVVSISAAVALQAGCALNDQEMAATTPTLADSTNLPTDSPAQPSATPEQPTATPSPSPYNTPFYTPVQSTDTEEPVITWLVSKELDGDFQDIQDAIDAVDSGDRLLVGEGIWPGPVDLGRKNLTIEARGAAEHTVIDASACKGDRCSAVIISGGQSASTVLKGFTLTGGSGARCPDEDSKRCGGGLFVYGSTPRLDRLLLVANQADYGAGAYLHAAGSRAGAITNVSVFGNRAERSGGGLSIAGGPWDASQLWITDNSASLRGGGVHIAAGEVSLSSTLIVDNFAAIGGGLSVLNATLGIRFAVFSENTAADGGAISLGDGAQLTLEGSILHRDEADQGPEINLGCASCGARLLYTTVDPTGDPWGGDTQALTIEDTVLTANPRFVAEGDFRLRADSPCVDAGPPDVKDPDGSRSDQGAYASSSADRWDLDGDGAYQPWEGEDAQYPWDCDDTDPQRSPRAAEVCDGVDNNCDAVIPEDEADWDGDGARVCDEVPECDDFDAAINPSATEGAEGDGLDNDCDTLVDEGTSGVDADGDGYCVGYAQEGDTLCSDGSLPGDCDDSSAARWPDADEICDGVENNCDGVLPDGESDWDLDGYRTCDGDSDDRNAWVYPGAPEAPSGSPDGLDNDGDGRIDEGTVAFDDDGDGFCESGPCTDNLPDGDCDDGANCPSGDAQCLSAAAMVGPQNDEICDGQDNNCDGALLESEHDLDRDGYLECDGDCDDRDAARHPGALDVEGNGIDEDCNGVDKGAVGIGRGEAADRFAVSCASGGAGAPGWAWLIGLAAILRRRPRCRT